MALEFGSGSQADPYLLVNIDDVKALFNTHYNTGKYFALISDLDLGSSQIDISYRILKFNLDGRGYKLTLKLNATGASFLFQYVENSLLKDVWLKINCVNTYLTGTSTSSLFNLSNAIFEVNKGSYYTLNLVSGENGIFMSGSANDRGHPTAVNIYKYGVAVANTINISSFPDKNPFNRNNYLPLNESKWIFDGISLPRPRQQGTADLTTRYALKGLCKVGENGRQRNLAVFTENGLRYKVQDTKADGSFFLNLNDVTTPVIVLAYDDIGAKAAINTAYSLNQIIHPATPNGFRYRCTLAGNSGATIPPEPWSTTTVLTIGAAKFTPEPVYEPKAHGPLLPVLFNVVTEQPV